MVMTYMESRQTFLGAVLHIPERALKGPQMLPRDSWRDDLESFLPVYPLDDQTAFRVKAKNIHSDAGGNPEERKMLMAAPDTLGDRCKFYEQEMNSRCAWRGLPLIARVDGRAFHTLCRGLNRPYDMGMQRCMIETTKYLVDTMQACIGYTQSDEISLLWFINADSKSEYPFGGKLHKITSITASSAAAKFNKLIPELLPNKSEYVACFDCRVWQVPSKQDAFEVFLWRELDATRNSITMAARHVYSNKELFEKTSSEKQEMLFQKGINWNNYPDSFKRGVFIRRKTEERILTEEERIKIPEEKRPPADQTFLRSKMVELDVPPLRSVGNVLGFLFDGEDPRPRTNIEVQY